MTAGGLAMQPGATLVVNIASATSFDQLSLVGPVNLGSGNCTLQVVLGYAPGAGDSFPIVLNDGSDPVTGTFAGLPEGAKVNCGAFNGKPYSCMIAYAANGAGGDGGNNDIVLSNFRRMDAGSALFIWQRPLLPARSSPANLCAGVGELSCSPPALRARQAKENQGKSTCKTP